jgi:site-specific DNA recombinase
MTCGACGCAVTAEVKKGRYVYYDCTNYHRNCAGGYYREEVLEEQFAALVRDIRLDEKLAEWVTQALRESLAEETAFHQQTVTALTRQLEQGKRRLNQAYLDKLDGKITEEFWAEKSDEWREEKARLTAQLARQTGGDGHYPDKGVRILELAKRAYELYPMQGPGEKRKLLGFLLSNCTLAGGRITPTYKQPLDILTVMAERRNFSIALDFWRSWSAAGFIHWLA